MKPKHISFVDLFNTRRLVVAVMLGVLICFWAFFLLPAPVMDWITARAETAGKALSPVFALLGTSALSFLALYLIGEPLVHGTSRPALFFQAQFPSKKLAAAHRLDVDTASRYFLRYYDCWQFDSEPEHVEYVQTTQLRFWCLFDFLTKRLLLILLILSAAALAYQLAFESLDGARLASQLIFVALMAAILVLLALINVVGTSKKSAKGCWRAWEEQNRRNYGSYVSALGTLTPSTFDKVNEERLRKLIEASR